MILWVGIVAIPTTALAAETPSIKEHFWSLACDTSSFFAFEYLFSSMDNLTGS
jgi:hypothetical protein